MIRALASGFVGTLLLSSLAIGTCLFAVPSPVASIAAARAPVSLPAARPPDTVLAVEHRAYIVEPIARMQTPRRPASKKKTRKQP